MAEVQLPVVGGVSKKALIIGGVGSVGVMGLLWWRKKQAAAEAPTDTTDTGDLTDSTDYADAYGDYGYGTASGIPTYVDTPTTGAYPTPTNNAQWTVMAEQLLAGVVDPAALSAALGAYIAGKAVTADQESLIDQAISVAGYPPVGGPTGYPPGIHQQPPTGQTPTPTPTPTHGTANRIDWGGGQSIYTLKTTQPTWMGVLKAHYKDLPPPGSALNDLAYRLAHASGMGGATSPKGKTIKLPQTLPW